jgi:hypothetical protein
MTTKRTRLVLAVAALGVLLAGAVYGQALFTDLANVVRTDTGPPNTQTVLTPSNSLVATDAQGNVCRALFVRVAGDVVVTDGRGNQVTYPAVAANTLIPFKPRFLNTATTATVVCWTGW